MENRDERKYKALESAQCSRIDQIYDGKPHNIVCRVLNIYDWIKSNGGDSVMTLVVSDNSQKKIFLKIFNPTPLEMKFKLNDHIFVRNVKLFKNDIFFVQHPVRIEFLNKEIEFKRNRRDVCEIKDISTTKYIDISGIVIHKQKETEKLALLFVIDFTKNSRINAKLNRGKYTNDMVLHVKLWDAHCAIYNEISLGEVYKIENLKVEIQDNIIYGNLSDFEGCKIYQLKEPEIIKKFEQKKVNFQSCTENFYKDVYETLSGIKKEGYYKIKAVVLRYYPSNGAEIKICSNCKFIENGKTKQCKCDETFKTNIVVLKLLVKDKGGEGIILCKDEVCFEALNKLSIDSKEWECLIHAREIEGNLVFELKEICSA